MVGVNMSEALDDPDLGPPVVAHAAGAWRPGRRGRTGSPVLRRDREAA